MCFFFFFPNSLGNVGPDKICLYIYVRVEESGSVFDLDFCTGQSDFLLLGFSFIVLRIRQISAL